MINIELIISLILAAVVGALVEFLLGLTLPKKPSFRHIFTILIMIGAFGYMSVWLSNRNLNHLPTIELLSTESKADLVTVEPMPTQKTILPTSTTQVAIESTDNLARNLILVRYTDLDDIFIIRRPSIFTEETITLGENNFGKVFFTGEAFENSLAIVFTTISESEVSDEEWHVWSTDALLRKNKNPITIIPDLDNPHSVYAEWEEGAVYFEEESGVVLMIGINGPILTQNREKGHEIIESTIWYPSKAREAIQNKLNE